MDGVFGSSSAAMRSRTLLAMPGEVLFAPALLRLREPVLQLIDERLQSLGMAAKLVGGVSR